MASNKKPAVQDVGAAFMAWYAETLHEFPDGLVSQSQAAEMLGVGRMAASRLVSRGYLRAVYFPKAPEISGYSVTFLDGTWNRLLDWFGDVANKLKFPNACYVSFGDVMELWQNGDARKKCRLDWNWILEKFRSKREDVRENQANAAIAHQVEVAKSYMKRYGIDADADGKGLLAGRKVYVHDELLDWFESKAKDCNLKRNQLVFWAMKQWRAQYEPGSESCESQARLPDEDEADRIGWRTKDAVMAQCADRDSRWVRGYDEFGGELGTYGSTGLRMDGQVD